MVSMSQRQPDWTMKSGFLRFFDPATGNGVASAGTVVSCESCSDTDTTVSRFAEASAWRGGGEAGERGLTIDD